MTADLIVAPYSGPRGWSEGLRSLGLTDIGIELDDSACRTAVAAGHRTIRADVAQFPLDHLVGRVDGAILSPPCQAFSTAGTGEGRDVIPELAAAIGRGDWGWSHSDDRVRHVLEVGRWAETLRPRWVACEQVPPVLPLWRAYADRWRHLYGWSVWAGVLNAADYGIVEACPLHATQPQTGPAPSAESLSRCVTALVSAERLATTSPDEEWQSPAVTAAALSARAIGRACAGSATPSERQQALGALLASEGRTTRAGGEVASWTIEATSGFGLTPGTAESIASLLSVCLADPSLAAKWSTTSTATRRTTVQRTSRSIAATLITGPHTGRASRAVGCGLCVDVATPQTRRRAFLIARTDSAPASPPTPTHAPHATLFDVAPWVTMAVALGWHEDGASWPYKMPATTIAGDPRITARCHHDDGTQGANAKTTEQVRAGEYEGTEPIRLTVAEATTLQAFPADYPWRGTRGSVHEQIGNAVPPPLAAAVIAAVTGTSAARRAA